MPEIGSSTAIRLRPCSRAASATAWNSVRSIGDVAENQVGHDAVERRPAGGRVAACRCSSGSTAEAAPAAMTVTVSFGNKRRRTCPAPAARTGCSPARRSAPARPWHRLLSAIIAGAVIDLHQAAGDGDAGPPGRSPASIAAATALISVRVARGWAGSSGSAWPRRRNGCTHQRCATCRCRSRRPERFRQRQRDRGIEEAHMVERDDGVAARPWRCSPAPVTSRR